jgi:hypothetical protein
VETCFGPGVSGGLSVTGFGASFGAGQWDNDCNARLYGRTLFAMGYKREAIQLLVNESGMVQRAFGLGANGGAPGVIVAPYGAAPSYRRAVNGYSGCTKWRNDVVGLQCLY